MVKQIGSQLRESIDEAGYVVVHYSDAEVVLQPIFNDGSPSGPQEIWFAHDDNAGYTLDIGGIGYEFARTVVVQFPYRMAA